MKDKTIYKQTFSNNTYKTLASILSDKNVPLVLKSYILKHYKHGKII